MLLNRLEFTFTLEVMSALTIGTGNSSPLDEDRNILEIHTDKEGGNPYIPATSLKGALRAHFNDDLIFGKQSDEGKGNMGQLLLYAATTTEKNVYNRPATSINRKTGTAEKGKLFSITHVKEGTEFKLTGMLMLKADDKTAAETLAKIFAPLKDGLTLGKGTKLGLGRVKIKTVDKIDLKQLVKSTLELTCQSVIESFERHQRGKNSTNADIIETLTLTCKGAYISIGENNKTDKGNKVKYLRNSKCEPILLPSSLYGVMRSRAAWLLELKKLRGEYKPSEERETVILDDRFGKFKKVNLELLTPVERLFGVTGYKGLLNIEAISYSNAFTDPIRNTTHIAIDRFTGGSLAGALFEVEAVEGCIFTATFSYSDRMEENPFKEEDKSFFKELIQDLITNEIMLGYGASKGYGWFTVIGEG